MSYILPERAANSRSTRAIIRVMIVDDSVVARSILTRILSRSEEIQIVVEAQDANSALAALAQHAVDIILLDIEMPGQTGLDALPEMVARSNGAGIIVVSSFAEANGPSAIRALSLGACDTLAKPGRTGFSGNFSTSLVDKVINLSRAKMPVSSALLSKPADNGIKATRMPDCIAIGASTGGIPAIFEIVEKLDSRVDCPIFVTQHLPDAFMTFFARQLSRHTTRKVLVAEENLPVNAGHIYVAPGNSHLVCKNVKGQIHIGAQHVYSASRYCPSVDAMLESIAEIYGHSSMAVILSGMGQDGLLGARMLASQSARVIAQDVESSVVWGMPGAIVREGIATAILNPSEIASMLNKLAGL
jgi:two-component system chemotaxis response regulator CheB